MELSEEKIEEKAYIGELLSLYGGLLTENVRRRMEAFYFEDYSLGEIAYNEKVSRNAVYESLLSGQKLLFKYEDKLHLYKRNQRLLDQIDKLEKSASEEEKIRICEAMKGEFHHGI